MLRKLETTDIPQKMSLKAGIGLRRDRQIYQNFMQEVQHEY